ncbi:MAG: hypothetical protein MOB07_26205 [Acidobacteria bacterium]|nr:hypothetical protein [Acidobacteriota bacterium]
MSNPQNPDNGDKNNTTHAQTNVLLLCDKCGAENWNLASEGKPHDQQANEVKGYDTCDGIWRRPGKLIQFPAKQRTVKQ